MTGRQGDIAVIGGGAAGMMAALQATAGDQAPPVRLYERNEKVGRKLAITGKGRCNLTNCCEEADFLTQVPGNGRFLYSAIYAFPPAAAMAFFTDLGVPLKVERGNRVFPRSDRAYDVVDALYRGLRRSGVSLVHSRVLAVERTGEEDPARRFRLRTERGADYARCVIIATGGLSYPLTGSTGDGYAFAAALGHRVTEPRASLVALRSDDPACPALAGLSLRNVRLTVWEENKAVYQGFGEMLFTHVGVSGPLVLSASAHLRNWDKWRYRACIDLKPALEEKMLDKRLLSDFQKYQNRDLCNALDDLLPQKLIPVMLARCGWDGRQKVHSVTAAMRRRLLEEIKGFSLPLAGPCEIEQAVITAGGVSVKQVNPKTMESKLVPGLYFAGEVLDVDAYTGGYNLQIAWSTGFLAGRSAREEIQRDETAGRSH